MQWFQFFTFQITYMALSLAEVSDCQCFSEHDGHIKRQTREQWHYPYQFELQNCTLALSGPRRKNNSPIKRNHNNVSRIWQNQTHRFITPTIPLMKCINAVTKLIQMESTDSFHKLPHNSTSCEMKKCKWKTKWDTNI